MLFRSDAVSIISNQVTNMVTGSDWLASQYATVAGYVVPETTAGHTLTDGINMILS